MAPLPCCSPAQRPPPRWRAIWLVFASREPEQVAVEVALPPPAPQAPPEAASPPPPPVQPDGAGGAAADPSAVRPGAGNALTVPPVPANAFARVPPALRAAPLPPAPDPALVDTTAEGPLPRRGADGRLPWQAYARPFPDGDRRARIAVIVAGLGPSAIVTGEIIRRLPADVTFAFEPTAEDAARWGREARAAGHEIMLSLPVQGDAFPFVDPGPEALAGDATADENRARLDRLLARLAGYVGVLARVGAEAGAGGDAAATAALELAGKALADRGLLFATAAPVGSRRRRRAATPRRSRGRRRRGSRRRSGASWRSSKLWPRQRVMLWPCSSRRRRPPRPSPPGRPASATGRSCWRRCLRWHGRCKPVAADPPAPADLPYRRGVGALLFNAAGEVFVARRLDTRDAWQLPQGGIHKGETPREAVFRELVEEIGTDRADVIAKSRRWLRYDLPPELVGRVWNGRYRGQEQRWFALRFTGTDGRHRPRRPRQAGVRRLAVERARRLAAAGGEL